MVVGRTRDKPAARRPVHPEPGGSHGHEEEGRYPLQEGGEALESNRDQEDREGCLPGGRDAEGDHPEGRPEGGTPQGSEPEVNGSE
jgi:hypothetical protein